MYPAHLMMLAAWVGILLAALVLRRRAPENRLIVHVLAQLYAIGFSLTSYCLGHHTSGYMASVIMGGVIVGFTFFDRTPVLLATGSILVIVIGTSVAEQAGLIPYAPLLTGAPFAAGHLMTSWMNSYAALTLVVVIVVAGLVYHISYRLRDSEDELTRAGEQLARANELISRYVAAQVAEQIMAGNYAAVNQHARRRLTIFFSDIVGFTEIADRLEPEDVSQVLNDYFSEMSAIAESYGGTIDKFIGDAVMILFGAPVACAEHTQALAAVRMALEMQQAIARLGQQWRDRGIEADFRVRIGINTGVATVGNFGSSGRMDYTAIGRQVNLASRLQAGCAPGKIAISHASWLLVHDEIPCVSRGEVSVKGLQQPVKVYEVSVEDQDTEGLRERS